MARTGIERASVKSLIPDKKNPNRGNDRGAEMIGASLERLGAGRSIVVDKNGVVLGGNQTLKVFKKLGKDAVEIVDSDGSKLIVVRRNDLDLENDPDGKARELSLADNRTQEVSYEVDPTVLAGIIDANNLDLSWMYSADELAAILAANGDVILPPTASLADRFGVPPFSILDARQGYWQERKRAWLALGIESELGRGRGHELTNGSVQSMEYSGGFKPRHGMRAAQGMNTHSPSVKRNSDGTLNYGTPHKSRANAEPGGSKRPAKTRARGNGAGRAI